MGYMFGTILFIFDRYFFCEFSNISGISVRIWFSCVWIVFCENDLLKSSKEGKMIKNPDYPALSERFEGSLSITIL